MSSSNVRPASTLIDGIRQQLQADLQAAAWTSPADRALLEAIAVDAASVVVLSLTASPAAAAREKAQVNAQLANLKSIESTRLATAFWNAVAVAARTVISVALAVA